MPDITEAAHERDGDGNLLPVTHEVEVRGEEYEVDVYPATSGDRKAWRRRLEDQGEELDDDVEADLLDEFANYDPDDFGADSWDDVRPGITDALGEAVFHELFDTDQDVFAAALESRQAEATAGNPD